MNSEMNSELSFVVHTYGCKVNTYDSGLLQKRMESKGYSLQSDQPRIHVLNTCAVTAEATKEAVRQIRRIKSREPLSTIVVTGCAAQVDTGAFENLPGADLVIANSHKGQLEDLLRKHFAGTLEGRVFKSNIFRKEDLEEGGGIEADHTRSFLKIQDGCNSFCTYCVIPFARGKSRSVPRAELVRRINELYEQGVREVVLTGVHIGDYEEAGHGLEDLIETLLSKTSMPRYRLSSLEPVELSQRLLDLYQDDRLCPHFHMSIQSANTEILAGMKRKYQARDVETSLNTIAARLKNPYVGMDVIVGFPGETEERFLDTYQRLSDLPWSKIHVFPYSERPGTKAVQLGGKVKASDQKEHARRLRELSWNRQLAMAERQLGTEQRVLRLKASKGMRGISREYWNIEINQEIAFGEEARVRIIGSELDILRGEVLV